MQQNRFLQTYFNRKTTIFIENWTDVSRCLSKEFPVEFIRIRNKGYPKVRKGPVHTITKKHYIPEST